MTIALPEVSIIIPVFNSEKYLGRCIDNILAQTFTNFECILINDGSTDSSSIICEKYRQSNNRIIVIHQENSGVSISRNRGLDVARGKYICFVDSDDYVEKNMLENLVVEINNSDTDVICCGYNEVNRTNIIANKDFIFHDRSTIELIHYLEMKQAFGVIWNKLYKKNIIDIHNIRFSTFLKFGEDMVFSLQYFSHVKTAFITVNCFYYYMHDNPNALTKESMTFAAMKYRFESVTNAWMNIDNNTKSLFYVELLAKDFIYTIAMLFRLYSEIKSNNERQLVISQLKKFYVENKAKNKFRTKIVALTFIMLVYSPPKVFGLYFSLIFRTYSLMVKIGKGKARFVKN